MKTDEFLLVKEVGIGLVQDIVGNQAECLIAKLGVRVEMLQPAKNGNHSVAAFGIESDFARKDSIPLGPRIAIS